jgi:large subunit ribosomal protein L2
MPVRTYKPTSAGRRFQTVQTFDEITSTEPYKPLTEPLKKSGGRNNQGELTSWWRGGGHKRTYRIIDFRRDKRDIPATVSTIEYDPNRSARIALVTYAAAPAPPCRSWPRKATTRRCACRRARCAW